MAIIFEQIIAKADYRLPIAYAREIGRIVVRWAYFEHQIQTIIYGVVFAGDELGAALGRLAVREHKFPDRLDLIKKVARVRAIGYDKDLLASIRKQCEPVVEERNLIAHGIWTKDPEYGWLVQQISGAWPQIEDIPAESRKIRPEAIHRTPDDLKRTVEALDRLNDDAKKFRVSLHFERKPSPDKHR